MRLIDLERIHVEGPTISEPLEQAMPEAVEVMDSMETLTQPHDPRVPQPAAQRIEVPYAVATGAAGFRGEEWLKEGQGFRRVSF